MACRVGQFSLCRFQTELKKLLNTQHRGTAADVVVLRNGLITLPDSESKRNAARRVRRFSSVRDLRMDSSLSKSCSLNRRGLRFFGKGMTH